MKIEVLPEVLNEELPLPNIKVDSSSVHPATEAFEAVGVKNKIPDIPPPRISFAPVDLLRTHSANIAYEMNLLQKEWSELYDRLAQREELKALNDARLETIEGMSILWRKLNHKYSSALKLENVQAVIDEQARAARRMKRERLAAVKEDTKRLAKLRFDHEQKKSRKHDLEVKEAKILSKSKRPQIDQLQDEMTKLEAEMARLRRNIDPENATGDKQTSEGVASTSASRLNKRQFEDVQEEITFSTQAKDVSKPSPLELLISTHVKVAFARPINSPGGMLSVLRGGLFADDDYVKSVKEDAKVLRELFEVSQSLRSTGACFTMGDSSRISTKGELVGCADRDLRHRITTESKSFRSISNVLLKASMHCRKANSIPTESWQVFSPCEVLPPMC
ncbi:hypothetical protein DFH28DRAFT_1063335 [Melampsora americana]|nr:hypothetical protein DFH28DRAFT_1063335 [Melampsora americana]